MWQLLKADEAIGMQLTESFAMTPAAAVSGLYFGGAASQYFAVGRITVDQVKSLRIMAPKVLLQHIHVTGSGLHTPAVGRVACPLDGDAHFKLV